MPSNVSKSHNVRVSPPLYCFCAIAIKHDWPPAHTPASTMSPAIRCLLTRRTALYAMAALKRGTIVALPHRFQCASVCVSLAGIDARRRLAKLRSRILLVQVVLSTQNIERKNDGIKSEKCMKQACRRRLRASDDIPIHSHPPRPDQVRRASPHTHTIAPRLHQTRPTVDRPTRTRPIDRPTTPARVLGLDVRASPPSTT
jgi:hypothetical protein